MIYVTQLLYLHPGHETEFHRFEDMVLPLLSKHRGELVLRVRPNPSSIIGGVAEPPYEVHVVRFETDDDLVSYSNDEERQRWLSLKENSIRSAVLIKGMLL
jgi:antibiotic biosynthesis monooxygenase (ABM) superfamily enzyme